MIVYERFFKYKLFHRVKGDCTHILLSIATTMPNNQHDVLRYFMTQMSCLNQQKKKNCITCILPPNFLAFVNPCVWFSYFYEIHYFVALGFLDHCSALHFSRQPSRMMTSFGGGARRQRLESQLYCLPIVWLGQLLNLCAAEKDNNSSTYVFKWVNAYKTVSIFYWMLIYWYYYDCQYYHTH